MKTTIFLDFDGTLVDVWNRYFGVFREYIKKQYGIDINNKKEEYIKLKRLRYKDSDIVEKMLAISELDLESYLSFKRESLESRLWLKTDFLFDGVKDILRFFKENSNYSLKLISQRHHADRLIKQLKDLKIYDLFDSVIVVKPSSTGNAKIDFLKGKVTKADIIIGDSPVEYEVAKILGIRGFFVETGLWDMSQYSQQTYKSLNEIFQIIKQERELYGI